MKQFLLVLMICLVPGLTYTIRPSCAIKPCPPQYQQLRKTFGLTKPCDDLWQISKRIAQHNQLKPQQVMLALLKANPKAFYKRNINGLRTGYYLHIPSVHKMRAISKRAAYRAVRRQNIAWQKIKVLLAQHPTRHYLKLRKMPCPKDHHKKLVHRLHYTKHIKKQVNPRQRYSDVDKTPQLMVGTDQAQQLKNRIEQLKQQNLVLNDQVNNLLLQKKRWQMINFQQMQKIVQLEAEIDRLNKQIVQPVKSSAPTLSQVSRALAVSAILDDANLKISRFSFHLPFTNRIVELQNFQPVSILLLAFIIILLFIWLTVKRRTKVKTDIREKDKLDASELVKQVEKEMEAFETEVPKEEIKTTEQEVEIPKVAKQDSYEYLSGEDVITSKLDLAHAYLDMGEHKKARELLESVVKEGNAKQRTEAKKLLKNL